MLLSNFAYLRPHSVESVENSPWRVNLQKKSFDTLKYLDISKLIQHDAPIFSEAKQQVIFSEICSIFHVRKVCGIFCCARIYLSF